MVVELHLLRQHEQALSDIAVLQVEVAELRRWLLALLAQLPPLPYDETHAHTH